MTVEEAASLIRFETESSQKNPLNWADIGCGTGTFTLALATLLPAGSQITAVDREAAGMKRIPEVYGRVQIAKVVSDAIDYLRGSQRLDGIIMANALHFIREQETFLTQARKVIKPGGLFLMVEYDMTHGSRWVPYPLPPARAENLFAGCGFSGFSLLGRKPSRYGPQFLYAALAQG